MTNSRTAILAGMRITLFMPTISRAILRSSNKAGELISGYSCDEARRMNVTEFIAPEFIDHVRAEFGQKIRVQLGTVQEIDIIAEDGKRVALEVSTRVILREGRPSEIQGIAVPSVLRGDSEDLPGRSVQTGTFPSNS